MKNGIFNRDDSKEFSRGKTMTKIKSKFAKDFKCSRCGRQAVVFVGLNDPDAMEYPMCRKCADGWKLEAIMEMSSIGEDNGDVFYWRSGKTMMKIKMSDRDLKKDIYKLMDSFLVETAPPRTLDQLNQDRHLFVGNMENLFRSWVLGMVKEVRDVNESNGRYNACNEMEKKIEETGK